MRRVRRSRYTHNVLIKKSVKNNLSILRFPEKIIVQEIIVSKEEGNVYECLTKAYYTTSRALVSTTAVLFLSSLGLLFSSFQHVFSLGLLIASASIIALIGDLIFMPAAVLTFKPLNNLLSSKMKNSVALNNKI